MSPFIVITSVYVLFMYFFTLFIYKRRGVEISRLQALIQSIASGAIFFGLLYFLLN